MSRLGSDPTSISFGTVLIVLNVLNIYTDMTTQLFSGKGESEIHTAAQRKPKYYVNDSDSTLDKQDQEGLSVRQRERQQLLARRKLVARNDLKNANHLFVGINGQHVGVLERRGGTHASISTIYYQMI